MPRRRDAVDVAVRDSLATASFDTGLAKKLGLISTGQNRVLLTTVAMSMAATPFVAQLGDTIAKTSASPVADNSTADLDRFRDAVLNVPTSADDEFCLLYTSPSPRD